ncbi:MAG: hypothetical protein ACRDJM_06355 [Actinomycetota bacterium]
MRRIDARESGTSIFEVTVTVAVVASVLAAVLASLVSAQRSQTYVSARASALDSLRIAMNVLTKEVRQAVSVDPTSTPSEIIMYTYLTGQSDPQLVRYTASAGTLTREEAGIERVVLSRLASTVIFSYTPTPGAAQVVKVDLQVNPLHAPDTTVRLVSDIRLRNRGRS